MAQLNRVFGRQAFGDDPANYDSARPGYPDWVYETLRGRCGLKPGAAVLDIGAGTGVATRPLLAAGALVTAVEPDARSAAFLAERSADPSLTVIAEPFDAADLPPASFDLAVCATAFHWLDEDAAMAKIAGLVKPGGWWAPLWNVFGDDSRPDPFHEATQALFARQIDSPSAGERGIPYALDTERRVAAMVRSGAFEDMAVEMRFWELHLTTAETVAIYATYSNVTARENRDEVLAGLARIADEAFGGHVVRNAITVLYTARRR